MLRLLLNAKLRLAIVAGLGAGFAILAFQFGWFNALDTKVYDLGLSIRPATRATSNVVVVAIDKYSRQHAFPPPEFPVSAHVREHAEAIARLVAAGAKVIDLDILFDQLDPGLDLTSFVAALGKSPRVCLAGAIEKRTLALRTNGSAIAEERLVTPTERIPDSLYCIGLVNMPVDADGVVRRSSYGQEFQGEWIPSMPAALAAAYVNGKPGGPEGDNLCKARQDAYFYIDYRSAGRGVATIPYVDVLTSDGWQDQVRGRIVLIGVTENSLSDIYDLPIRGLPGAEHGNKLPGVMVLAYSAQTLVSGSVVSPIPRGSGLILGLGLALAAGTIGLRRGLRVSAGLIAALLLGIVVCGILASGLRLAILPSGLAVSVTMVTAVIALSMNYLHTRLRSEVQEKQLEEIGADLKKAAEIQQSLQPESMPVLEGAQIAGLQVPCKEIGGDYYDAIGLGERKVGLLIADVCGKGVSAALLMSNLQSSVRQLAPNASSPRALVAHLNTVASKVFGEGRFVTLLYGILDVPDLEFCYCSAGHMPPLLCRGDGEVAELEPGGLPVGIFPDFDWQESTVELRHGDLLFMYTDGLSEAAAPRTQELYGLDRIKAWLAQNLHKTPDELNRHIVEEARRFSGAEHLDDDITLLTVRIA